MTTPYFDPIEIPQNQSENLEITENQKPLRDLSKLQSHPNTISGNLDDLVNITWENEWHYDFD